MQVTKNMKNTKKISTSVVFFVTCITTGKPMAKEKYNTIVVDNVDSTEFTPITINFGD